MRNLMRRRERPEYWLSVRRLMETGWYRVGCEPDGAEAHWRFRYGHTFETATDSQRVVAAPAEASAIHLLSRARPGAADHRLARVPARAPRSEFRHHNSRAA